MAEDMRPCITFVCNADDMAILANYDSKRDDHPTPMREMFTVADLLRWYEQSPQAEQPA